MSEAGSGAFLRGAQLFQLGRHEEAAASFREAIANDADDAEAHAQLALCLAEIEGGEKDALGAIERAIGLEPECGCYHAWRAIILSQMDKGNEALAAARQAVALDPEEAFHHAAIAQAHVMCQQWVKAETAARKALAIDGDDGLAQNVLALALRLQGRLEENELAVDQLLAKDPEDELAHVNAGYSALQRNDHRKAEEHFREALRLDPSFDLAREGLLDSFRARSWFYRRYLRYCFFMQRFSRGSQWAIIIGVYLAFRFGRALLGAIHTGWAALLALAYLLLVFWVWLAPGIGHFLVLCDRSARFALKRREILEAIFVGGGFFAGVGLLAAAFLGAGTFLALLGGTMIIGALPAALVFTNDSRRGRLLFGGVFLYIYGSGLALSVAMLVHPGLAPDSPFFGAAGLGVLAVLLCTWLSNVRSLRR